MADGRAGAGAATLDQPTDAIKEIAAQVGYGDHYLFSKDFKKLAGVPPREYRRREAARSGGR